MKNLTRILAESDGDTGQGCLSVLVQGWCLSGSDKGHEKCRNKKGVHGDGRAAMSGVQKEGVTTSGL
ncbi:hypothetical protein E2C01_057328 [Portunus trituberculatus]|uniref:Uncharacterized protein n=1 Tax=Portunus trituberculatus TaxID=210409 RepID=A0A5B7H0R5_PORTR|nr:hypothetical protein [Portunus trituberculatus]